MFSVKSVLTIVRVAVFVRKAVAMAMNGVLMMVAGSSFLDFGVCMWCVCICSANLLIRDLGKEGLARPAGRATTIISMQLLATPAHARTHAWERWNGDLPVMMVLMSSFSQDFSHRAGEWGGVASCI